MELNRSKTDFDKNVDFMQISINLKRKAYKFIGMGSGRLVFDMGNGYVVKVARNQKGIGQNKAEYKVALVDDSDLFAKILSVSEGFQFVIMDKADKIKDITFVWDYFNVKNNHELCQTKKLQDISSRYGLLFSDLTRAVNWGQINGKPVIIDYGFTREVRRRFYLPPFFRILRR